MAGAVVWTYWLAPPLLSAMVALVVALGVLYHRRVVRWRYRLLDRSQGAAADVVPLATRPTSDGGEADVASPSADAAAA